MTFESFVFQTYKDLCILEYYAFSQLDSEDSKSQTGKSNIATPNTPLIALICPKPKPCSTKGTQTLEDNRHSYRSIQKFHIYFLFKQENQEIKLCDEVEIKTHTSIKLQAVDLLLASYFYFYFYLANFQTHIINEVTYFLIF